MKIQGVITMVLATAATAFAAPYRIVVCSQLGNGFAISQGESVASTIYSMIGVRIEWRRPSSCPADAIHIDYSYRTPDDLMPGSWAYARPYEGIHIVVFYDRIVKRNRPDLVATTMGHVFAHEIGHILEGVNEHSETGIMKATWAPEEIEEMKIHPMTFADRDVKLIRRNLEARAKQIVVLR